MPFIIVQASSVQIGKQYDAFFAGPNINGEPDFRNRMPVRIVKVSEGKLTILPADHRVIISTTSENSKTTIRVEPGVKAQAAAVRLARIAKATELLQQLASALAAVEPPAEATAGLETLSRWLRGEREKAARGTIVPAVAERSREDAR